MTSCHSSSGGSIPRHASGLDSKICAEVTHAVSGMTRAEVDEIVKQIIPLYVDELDGENFLSRIKEELLPHMKNVTVPSLVIETAINGSASTSIGTFSTGVTR